MDIDIQNKLLSMAEPEYKAFQCKLMPTVDQETVIGIRTPLLRAMAKELKNTDTAKHFLQYLPHRYYEENNLHGFLISQISDLSACVEALDHFLPYVDNWATCDGVRPKCFSKHRQELLTNIDRWLASEHIYTVRFAIEMLMCHFLDSDFSVEFLEKVVKVKSGEYYVDMMIAWYFATALAKQWNHAVTYLEQKRLNPWIHNKTLQKAVESYRITPEQKTYLRTLRV